MIIKKNNQIELELEKKPVGSFDSDIRVIRVQVLIGTRKIQNWLGALFKYLGFFSSYVVTVSSSAFFKHVI